MLENNIEIMANNMEIEAAREEITATREVLAFKERQLEELMQILLKREFTAEEIKELTEQMFLWSNMPLFLWSVSTILGLILIQVLTERLLKQEVQYEEMV